MRLVKKQICHADTKLVDLGFILSIGSKWGADYFLVIFSDFCREKISFCNSGNKNWLKPKTKAHLQLGQPQQTRQYC